MTLNRLLLWGKEGELSFRNHIRLNILSVEFINHFHKLITFVNMLHRDFKVFGETVRDGYRVGFKYPTHEASEVEARIEVAPFNAVIAFTPWKNP